MRLVILSKEQCDLMRYVRNAIIAMLILLLMPTGALAVTAKVTSGSARVYRSASTSSANAALKQGLCLTVNTVSGAWAKVSYKGVTGYVPTKYLSTTDSTDTAKGSRCVGYINKQTVAYTEYSKSSEQFTLEVNAQVTVVGQKGSYYQIEADGRTGYVPKSCVSQYQVAADVDTWKSSVVTMNWFSGGSSAFPTGSYGYIYDIDTGIYLRIKRMGGYNHADVEPATSKDTAKLKKIAGGTFSWDSHAVILKAGSNYIACAINTKPHGKQTIKNNNYNGQFCLHMVGSITHGTESVNSNHQASIQKAYNWAH